MKNKPLKIVTIGGGSSYTPELVDGFIKRYDSLPVGELWLVDIADGEKKLNIVADLARRMVEKANVPIKIFTTLNRREALVDADFVTTQFRVGQLDARILDEKIPLSHGLLGQETNGAGGLFKGLRTIPVILDICKDINELCENAWLINFTNPSGMVTEAINKYGNLKKSIGLCNISVDMHKQIATLLEKEPSDVKILMAGLNHMLFVTEITCKGQDVMDFVIENWGTQSVKNISSEEPWDKGFLRELHAIPCSYHRYYYMTKEYLEEDITAFNNNGTRAEKVKAIEQELFELYKDKNLNVKPKQLELRGGAYYSDAACNLISSIYNDTGDIQIVNTVNKGSIADFEYDEVVEVSCMITRNGPIPLTIGKLPKMTKGLINQIKSFEIKACEAAVTGDYDKGLAAMMINPLVASQKTGKLVYDELLYAHKKYLPLFDINTNSI